uniref:Aegyptin/gSG7 salivary protein-like four-helix bundle domain-containing protein n=1 Tax=Anopheles christyi TaxID=43041 RepID=A0A182KBI0_9DIPT
MQAKLVFVLIAFGVMCLLQATPTKASTNHVQQLMKVFRSLTQNFDYTKKSFYLNRAKYGVQNQMRNPLVSKASHFPENAKLSDACLKQMVAKVNDLEESFYASFSYNCHDHDQYSMDCLEAAEPAYLSGLTTVAEETEKCLREQ